MSHIVLDRAAPCRNDRCVYKFDVAGRILCIDYSRADRPGKFATKEQPALAMYKLKKTVK